VDTASSLFLRRGFTISFLRQYFRNGVESAYVQKFYPNFVINQSLDHVHDAASDTSLRFHASRYAMRLLSALGSGRWVYAGTLVMYALGHLWSMCAQERSR